MPPRGNVHVRITGDASDLERANRKGERSFGLLKKATASAAVGVAGGIAAMVNTAADFEAQMSTLESVTEGNARTMERFRAQALKAGADTAFSASEAASAQIELAKGGLSVANIMKGGLKSALALAAAGDLELADAAAYTANAMNLFGIEGSKSMKVADALAAAANATTADVSDFGIALTQGGGAAKSAGMSFQQTMLALEALAQSGVRGSDAGTSLKAALVQLAAPTAKQKELSEKLGLSFFNAEGKMKPLSKVSTMLRGELGKMGDQQRLATLKTLAGTDGFRALLAVYDQGPKKLNTLERGLAKHGSAAATAAKRQDNLKGSMDALGGSIETIAILAGSVLVPPLTDAANATADFIGEMATGKGAGGEFVQTLSEIGGVAVNVGQAVGPVAGDFIQLAGAFAQSDAAIVVLTAGVGALTGRMVGLGAAFAVGKIASYVGTIKTLAGAMGTLRTVYVAQTGVTNASTVAVLRHAAASRVAAGASRGLSAAMMSSGIGAIAVLAGTAIGALMGFKQTTDDAKISQQQFRDAILGVRNALDGYKDVEGEITDARLQAKSSALAAKDAEKALKDGRAQGLGAEEIERLELNVATAHRQRLKDIAALGRVERDAAAKKKGELGRAKEELGVAKKRSLQSRDHVNELKRERAEIKAGDVVKLAQGGDRYLAEQRKKLRSNTRELSAAERKAVNDTLAFRREQLRIAKATGASKDRINELRSEIKKLKGKKVDVEVKTKLDGDDLRFQFKGAIDGVMAGIPFQVRPNRKGKRNRRGGWAFQAGGMVPSVLSPGEVGILPNGSSFTVPGARVAADNFPMLLPPETAILTDHGQQLAAMGMPLDAVIDNQAPHFRDGGRVERFASGGLAGATAGARSLRKAGVKDPRQLVVMTATGGRESRWDPKAKGGPNSNGTFDHGWLQANDIWASKMRKLWNERYTFAGGSEIAKRIADAQGPGAWRLNGWTVDSTIKPYMGTAQRAVKRAMGGRGYSFSKVTQPEITRPLLGNMLAPLTDDPLMGGIEAGREGRSRRHLLTEVLEGIVPESEDRSSREKVSVSGSSRAAAGGFKPGGGWAGTKNLVMHAIRGLAGQSWTFKRSVAVNDNQNSDHNTWIKNAYAADGTPGSDSVFNTIGKRLGISAAKGSWNSVNDAPLDGYRSQLLWHAPDGSHKDHVHLGIRKMRKGGFVVPPSAEVAAHAAKMGKGGVAGRRIKVGQRIGGKDGRRRFDDNSGVVVREGKVVRAFVTVPKGWRNVPVSPIPNVGPMGLSRLVQKLGGSPGTAGADRLMRKLSNALPGRNMDQLLRGRRIARKRIRGMADDGFTGNERIKARRLRGVVSLLEDQMGRPIGRELGINDRVQDRIAGQEDSLGDRLTVAGIDPESVQGLQIQRGEDASALGQMRDRRAKLGVALRRAKKTGNKAAVQAVQEEIKETDRQILGLKASITELDGSIQSAAKEAPKNWANAELALAGLTETLDDDRAALLKLEDIAENDLNEAIASGDPLRVAAAAEALGGVRDSLKSLTEATNRNSDVLEGLTKEISRQNDFAESVVAITGAEAVGALASVLNNELGSVISQRVRTTGDGSRVRY